LDCEKTSKPLTFNYVAYISIVIGFFKLKKLRSLVEAHSKMQHYDQNYDFKKKIISQVAKEP
jgi:hypothetical protein